MPRGLVQVQIVRKLLPLFRPLFRPFLPVTQVLAVMDPQETWEMDGQRMAAAEKMGGTFRAKGFDKATRSDQTSVHPLPKSPFQAFPSPLSPPKSFEEK